MTKDTKEINGYKKDFEPQDGVKMGIVEFMLYLQETYNDVGIDNPLFSSCCPDTAEKELEKYLTYQATEHFVNVNGRYPNED